jgi:hypothetical protein
MSQTRISPPINRPALPRQPSIGTQDQGADGTCYAHVFARIARRLLTKYVVQLRETEQENLDASEQQNLSTIMTERPDDVYYSLNRIMTLNRHVENPTGSGVFIPQGEVPAETIARIKNALIYLFFYSTALYWGVKSSVTNNIIGGYVRLDILADFLNGIVLQPALNISDAATAANFPINNLWVSGDGALNPFLIELLDLFKQNAKILNISRVNFSYIDQNYSTGIDPNDFIFRDDNFIKIQSAIEEDLYLSILVYKLMIRGTPAPIDVSHAMTIVDCSKGNEHPRWIEIKNSWGINWPSPHSGGTIRVYPGSLSWSGNFSDKFITFSTIFPSIDFVEAPRNDSSIETYVPVSREDITDGQGHRLTVETQPNWFCDGIHIGDGCESGNNNITFMNCNAWHSGDPSHQQTNGYDLCMLCATRSRPMPNFFQSINHTQEGHALLQGVFRRWNQLTQRTEVPLCSRGELCKTNNHGGPLYGTNWGYTWHCTDCEFNMCPFCVYYELLERSHNLIQPEIFSRVFPDFFISHLSQAYTREKIMDAYNTVTHYGLGATPEEIRAETANILHRSVPDDDCFLPYNGGQMTMTGGDLKLHNGRILHENNSDENEDPVTYDPLEPIMATDPLLECSECHNVFHKSTIVNSIRGTHEIQQSDADDNTREVIEELRRSTIPENEGHVEQQIRSLLTVVPSGGVVIKCPMCNDTKKSVNVTTLTPEQMSQNIHGYWYTPEQIEPVQRQGSEPSRGSHYHPVHINNLMTLGGIRRDEAIQLLNDANGNLSLAARNLVGNIKNLQVSLPEYVENAIQEYRPTRQLSELFVQEIPKITREQYHSVIDKIPSYRRTGVNAQVVRLALHWNGNNNHIAALNILANPDQIYGMQVGPINPPQQPPVSEQEPPVSEQEQQFQIGDNVIYDTLFERNQQGTINEINGNHYSVLNSTTNRPAIVIPGIPGNNIRLDSQMELGSDRDYESEQQNNEEDNWLNMPQLIEPGDRIRYYDHDGNEIYGTVDRFSRRQGNIMVLDDDTGEEFVLYGNENGLQIQRTRQLEVGDQIAFISGRNNRHVGEINHFNNDGSFVVWYGRGRGQYSEPLYENEVELISRAQSRGGKTRKRKIKILKKKTRKNKIAGNPGF